MNRPGPAAGLIHAIGALRSRNMDMDMDMDTTNRIISELVSRLADGH